MQAYFKLLHIGLNLFCRGANNLSSLRKIVAFEPVDSEMLQKQSPYDHQRLFGQWSITDEFKQALTNYSTSGDTIPILLSLDDLGRVPEWFSDLMPLPRGEIESLFKQNQTVSKGVKARDMNVFLLATPTDESLPNEFRRLVAQGKFTPDKEATTK